MDPEDELRKSNGYKPDGGGSILPRHRVQTVPGFSGLVQGHRAKRVVPNLTVNTGWARRVQTTNAEMERNAVFLHLFHGK